MLVVSSSAECVQYKLSKQTTVQINLYQQKIFATFSSNGKRTNGNTSGKPRATKTNEFSFLEKYCYLRGHNEVLASFQI